MTTVDVPIVLGFGKYKGSQLNEVPQEYLEYLSKSARDTTIKTEALILLGDMHYAANRMGGMPSNRTDFFITMADTHHISSDMLVGDGYVHRNEFLTLNAALWFLKDSLYCNGFIGMDMESDEYVVWEVNPEGFRRGVWQAWGWHFGPRFWGIEQGCLPGCDRTLYDMSDDTDNEEAGIVAAKLMEVL